MRRSGGAWAWNDVGASEDGRGQIRRRRSVSPRIDGACRSAWMYHAQHSEHSSRCSSTRRRNPLVFTIKARRQRLAGSLAPHGIPGGRVSRRRGDGSFGVAAATRAVRSAGTVLTARAIPGCRTPGARRRSCCSTWPQCYAAHMRESICDDGPLISECGGLTRGLTAR